MNKIECFMKFKGINYVLVPLVDIVFGQFVCFGYFAVMVTFCSLNLVSVKRLRGFGMAYSWSN